MFEKIVFTAVGYFLSFIYGLWFIFILAKRVIRDPFTPFWTVKPRQHPPECLNDRSLGNHCRIRLENNVTLHYVEKGDRSKPLMLCLHGFPEIWYSWRHQIKEFSSDYWVVAVDMRGYGESDKPVNYKEYTIELVVADIKNLIKALGKDKCTLLAHDWGGVIAWFLILTEPQLIQSYIVMNSIHPIAFRNHVQTSFSQLRKSWYIFFFQLPCLPELFFYMDDMALLTETLQERCSKSPPPLSDEEIEAYKYYFGKEGGFSYPIHYYRANFMLKARDKLKGRGQDPDFPPGLILFGEHDTYIDREIQDKTTELVANLSVVYIKDASHFVQQEVPETVNREMRNFFQTLRTTEKP